jgi:ribosome biogenesis GTPase A
MMGYPNVGKSALINRLLGIRRAKTANTPGVTLSLQWIRVKQHGATKTRELELLDSPGIIPAFLENQEDAALLAACNCIGDKAYDNQAIAAFFMEWVKALHVMNQQQVTCPQFRQTCKERYGLDPLLQPNLQPNQENGLYMTGQDILCQVADNKCRGDLEDASRKILQDFRKGRLGPICLQLAPSLASETDGDGQEQSVLPLQHSHHHAKSKRRQFEEQLELEERTRKERAVTALKTAKQQGLELPPSMVDETSTDKDNKDVGKGLFDGW